MKMSHKLLWVSGAALTGGVAGMLLAIALPETYTLVDFQQNPGVGSDRQCQQGDLVCKSQSWRESASGQDLIYSYTTKINDDATLQKALIFAGIGAASLGVLSLGIVLILPGKKSDSIKPASTEEIS